MLLDLDFWLAKSLTFLVLEFDIFLHKFGLPKPFVIHTCGLTQRAADGGYVPRYFGIFLTWGFSRFGGESTLPPTAANAHR